MTVGDASSEDPLGDPLSRRCLVRRKLMQEVIGKSHLTHLIRECCGFRPTAIIHVCNIVE